jgi:hypothetical protein
MYSLLRARLKFDKEILRREPIDQADLGWYSLRDIQVTKK